MKKISIFIICVACITNRAYGTSPSDGGLTTVSVQNSTANGYAAAFSTGGSVGNLSSSSVSAGGTGGNSYATGGNSNATGGNSNATGGNATGGTSSATTGAVNANTGASTSVNGGNTLVLKSGDTIVPQQLLSTIAVTENPHLYSIQGGLAQTTNLNLLLSQSWSPDQRDTADGKSCRTTIVSVTDYNIDKYKGAGANNFIFLDEKAPVPPGLGSITIYPRLNKGDEVDGSTLKSDIKTYVCNRYHGLNIYIKSSWAASSLGVHSKGVAASAVSSASFFPGNVVSGLAGALGGNKGATEATPIVSLTVILSDK